MDEGDRNRQPDHPVPRRLAEDFSAAEQSILNKINTKVAEGNSLPEILDFLFQETAPIMPCDRIGLAFLQEDGRRVVAHYAKARYEPLLLGPGYAADMAGSSLERVLQSGEPRIINDLGLYAYAHPRSDSTRLLLREGVRSSMTCPLVAGGRPLGFLFRSSRFPNAYSEREVRLHQAVAERLGQTVEKTHRIEQLEASNRAYMEMLGFVSHEIKNPLSTIISEGKVLEMGYLGELAPKQKEMVVKMLRKAGYLLNLTRQYLDLARLEEGRMEAHPRKDVDLAEEVLEPSQEMVHALIDEKRMKVALSAPSEPLRVECDPELLRIVATNLIGNAAKYGDEDGGIEIQWGGEPSRFTVSVRNEGPGFPESEKPNLFKRFSRLKTPEAYGKKGSGIGLYTSWRIIQQHGGRIWAESKYGSWAKFSFEIPQPLSENRAEKTPDFPMH